MSFHTHKKTNKQTQSYLYFFVYFVKQNFPLSKEEMTIDQKKREREKKKKEKEMATMNALWKTQMHYSTTFLPNTAFGRKQMPSVICRRVIMMPMPK